MLAYSCGEVAPLLRRGNVIVNGSGGLCRRDRQDRSLAFRSAAATAVDGSEMMEAGVGEVDKLDPV